MIEVVIPSVRERAIVQRLLDSIARADPQPDRVTLVRDDPEPFDGARVLCPTSDYYPIGFNDAALKRNVGIWAAESEVILFLDDDLLVPPTIFHSLESLFGPNDYAFGHHRFIDFTNWQPEEIELMPPQAGRARETPVPGFHQFYSAYAGNFAARRELLIHIGGFDMQFSMRHAGEDQHLGRRLMHRYGKDRVFIHEPPFAWHNETYEPWPERATNLCELHVFYEDVVDNARFTRCRNCPYLYFKEVDVRPHLVLPFEPDKVSW